MRTAGPVEQAAIGIGRIAAVVANLHPAGQRGDYAGGAIRHLGKPGATCRGQRLVGGGPGNRHSAWWNLAGRHGEKAEQANDSTGMRRGAMFEVHQRRVS
jgi:hypothetical protein